MIIRTPLTIKDVKVGTLYFEPTCVAPYNELCRVTQIIPNPTAGETVKDLWGGVVWHEPAYTIKSVGLTTGKEKGCVVQSDNQILNNGFLMFAETEEDYNEFMRYRN